MEKIQDILLNKALDLDTHESIIDDKSLVYLLNGDIVGNENGGNGYFVQNVLSNELCLQIPFGYELLGAVPLNNGQFSIFYKTPDSFEIGLFDSNTCAYIQKINNKCLDLPEKVIGKYKIKNGCDNRRVYYIGKSRSLKFFDIDECLPTKNLNDCFDCQKDEVFDCAAFNANRCIRFPKLKYTKTTGNLPNGVYQIAMALTEGGQRFSDYYIYPELVNFFSHNQANNRHGIEIDFESCPEGFDEYELVLIAHREDRATLAERVGTFPVTQTAYAITELDDSRYTPIDFQVLLTPMPRYISADGIDVSDETLVLSGVKRRKTFNYQPKANQIKSKWVVKKVPAKDAANHYSFMRGERYGFSINWLYCDGERTVKYHIPSDAEQKIRERGEWNQIWEPITGPDYWEGKETCGTPPIIPYWAAYDTSIENCNSEVVPPSPCKEWGLTLDPAQEYVVNYTNCEGESVTYIGQEEFLRICTREITAISGVTVIGGFNIILNTQFIGPCGSSGGGGGSTSTPCEDGICGEIVQRGDFGYWESDLQYPDNPCVWGQREDRSAPYFDPYGLSCQKIRYHQFPDNCTSHIHGKAGCNDEEFVYILGVEFTNVQRPVDEDGNPITDIVGYEISVTDRTNQKSILHKGLLYNMWEEKLADCSTSYYANYPFNDLNPDVFLSETRARYNGSGRYGEVNYTPVDTYSRDRFQYISPDVQYERNDSGTYLQLYTEENGYLSGKYAPTYDFSPSIILSDLAFTAAWIIGLAATTDITIGVTAGITTNLGRLVPTIQTFLAALNNTLPPVNYAMSYHAKTGYESYNCVKITPGNVRRKIEFSQYLLPTKMFAGVDKVNNYQRESGLYLKLSDDLQNPFISEFSRIRIEDNRCNGDFQKCDFIRGRQPRASSYYGAIRVNRPSQYGFPESNIYRTISGIVPVGSTNSGAIFGGDIRITKHKYIRKFPFFTALPLGLPIDTKFETSPYSNVWYPRYWLDNIQAEDVTSAITGVVDNDKRNLARSGTLSRKNCGDEDGDCNKNTFLRIDGKFYTHITAEAEYWCESEYVADYREKNEIPESDIDRAEDEKMLYRTVQLPELFLYSRHYHYKGLSQQTGFFDKDYDCCSPDDELCDFNNIAYSQKHDPLSKGDAWLKFLPNSFMQFSQRDGNLRGIKSVDDSNILFFFEDAVYVSQYDDAIQTENGRLYIGSPSVFSRRLRKLTDDDSGFGGCQDIDSVVVTRYGTFWADRKRGKFVMYADGITDITNRISTWGAEFLTRTDSVRGVWDNFTGNVYFTGFAKDLGQEKKWTLSYKPERRDWISFHSFTPDSYLPMPNNFLSVTDKGIWKHNRKYHYQTYYGIQCPFIVGSVLKDKMHPSILQDLEIYTEWYKNIGYNCKEYANKFFDQCVILNNTRSTGLRDLWLKNLNNENHYLVQDKTKMVEVSQIEDFIYRLNGFEVSQLNQPFMCLDFADYNWTDEYKVVTSDVLNAPAQMRGKWVKLFLLANENWEHKILLQLKTGSQDPIIR